MNKNEYDSIVSNFAQRALKESPEDPTLLTLEFVQNEIIDSLIKVNDVFLFSNNIKKARFQQSSYSYEKEELNYKIAIDALDWDLCERIRNGN